MSIEKKVEEAKEETKEIKKRQIIIETDGNSIQLIKSEVAGSIELKGILQMLIEALNNK